MLSYLGFFIGYVNMLWLFPYAFRPEEIGLIRLMLSLAAIFSIMASFGGPQVATRFFPYFAESFPRRLIFFRILIGFAFIGVVILSFCFIFFYDTITNLYSEKSPLLLSYFWYILPLAASLILYGILEAFVIVQGYPLVPTLLREVYTRAAITMAITAFIASTVSLSGFLYIVCILYCFAPVLLFIYGYREHIIPLAGSAGTISKTEMKEIGHFGAYLFIGNASAVILANIDSVVLSAYAGLTSAGIYGIAFFLAVIIEIPKRSLSQVLIPMVVKANKDHDIKALDVLYKKSSLNQFIIGAAIFLIVWLNIDGIFSLIPHGDIYREGKWVVLLIAFAKLFDMLTGINAEIIGTSQYYRIELFIGFIINLVGVSLNIILIPLYGLNGAACAVFVSVFLYNSIRFIVIAILMKIQPFTKNTIVAGIYALLTYGVISMIPSFQGTIIDIGLRTIFIGVIFGGLILGLHVSEDISRTFHKIVVRFYSHG
ncbi:MAG: oligosaccharide flippase family protein [Bacteroidota bacterium]